jgi:hypothetical protein
MVARARIIIEGVQGAQPDPDEGPAEEWQRFTLTLELGASALREIAEQASDAADNYREGGLKDKATDKAEGLSSAADSLEGALETLQGIEWPEEEQPETEDGEPPEDSPWRSVRDDLVDVVGDIESASSEVDGIEV